MTTIARPAARPIHPTSVPASSAPGAAQQAPAAPTAGWSPRAEAAHAAAPVAVNGQASPAEVATRFYAAFQNRDLEAMRALYAPNATFQDPIYNLHGRDETMKMWAGVFEKGKNGRMSFDVVKSDANSATIRWRADYELAGRPVHNESLTTLTVRDGAITAHRDDWSWSNWARQAIPVVGPLAGLPLIKQGLQALIRSL